MKACQNLRLENQSNLSGKNKQTSRPTPQSNVDPNNRMSRAAGRQKDKVEKVEKVRSGSC